MNAWVGQTISNVHIMKFIRRDPSSEIYIGHDTAKDRPVTIRILQGSLNDDPDSLQRFQIESRAIASLQHPNIIRCYHFDSFDRHPYMVLEPLDGVPLLEYLHELHAQGLLLPLQRVVWLISSIASAVDYAHAHGIIHRYINPKNILLRRHSTPFSSIVPIPPNIIAVLTGFGIAQLAGVDFNKMEDHPHSELSYQSPEQIQGTETDERTDIYSIGALLYEMLVGKPPGTNSNPPDSGSHLHSSNNLPLPNTPSLIQKIVHRALAEKPEARYQRAIDLADDLAKAAMLQRPAQIPSKQWTVSPPHPTMQMKSPRKSRRRLLIPILVVIIALVVIASLTILAFLGWRFLRNGGEIFSNIFKIGTASIFTFNLASKTNDASQINSS